MKITNRIVKFYLNKYANKLEAIRAKPFLLQKNQLDNILRTQFAKKKCIASVDKFKHLRPSTYEVYKSEIDFVLHDSPDDGLFSNVKYFAKSAGTSSGSSKYIPTSNHFLQTNHIAASWLTLYILYQIRHDMDVFSGKNLLVGGAIYENNQKRIIADISGIMISKIPRIFHTYYVPAIDEAIRPDWEKKLTITSQKAAQERNVVMFGGVPTWILTLFKDILSHSNKTNLAEIWPNLKTYLHGGVGFEPYRKLFEELIPIPGFQYLEVYNATEGFIAVQDTIINEGLLLLTGHGIYYEFIERQDFDNEGADIFSLEEVILDREYVILISTLSGLFRYVIGDVITFVSINPFRIRVSGRIQEYINAFGEDLNVSVAKSALLDTLSKHNASIINFTVAPKYIDMISEGMHQWFIEFEHMPYSIENFTRDLDLKIQSLNFNYEQKRTGSLAMSILEISLLPGGFFDAFAKKIGKFGGQNKLPVLRNDRILADQIIREMKEILQITN